MDRAIIAVHRLILAGVLLAAALVGAEDDGGGGESNANPYEDEDLAWVQAFSGLFPFLIAIFFVVFSLHIYLYPKYAERTLLTEEYLQTGTRMPGQSLSCEYREGSGGDAFLVDVAYKAKEHKYIDNPSMKFRNQAAFEEKSFLRRFEFGREVARGEELEVLIPDPARSVRSGLPTEVVERMLSKDAEAARRYRLVLAGGAAVVVVLLAFSVMAVVRMDEPGAGWVALIGGLFVIELSSFLFSFDLFMKSKRRKFDSARPTIGSAEQAAAQRAKEAAVMTERPGVPFGIMHDFAGHARASQRQAR